MATFAHDVDGQVDRHNRGNERDWIRNRKSWPDNEQQKQRQSGAWTVRQQPFGEVVDECRSLEELSWARRMHSYGVGERHVG